MGIKTSKIDVKGIIKENGYKRWRGDKESFLPDVKKYQDIEALEDKDIVKLSLEIGTESVMTKRAYFAQKIIYNRNTCNIGEPLSGGKFDRRLTPASGPRPAATCYEMGIGVGD